MRQSKWLAFLPVVVAFVVVGQNRVLAVEGSFDGEEPDAPTENKEEPMWWLGFQLHAVTDGAAPSLTPDTSGAYDSIDSMHFDWGGGFTLPLSLNFFNGLGMRVALSVNYSGDPPFDKATAQVAFLTQQDSGKWGGDRQYRTLDAFFAGGGLLFDIQYMFPLLFGAVKPYLGMGPGLYVNYVFTDLTESEFNLLANEYNDPNDDNNIDPYSVNVEPGFNGYLGLNFMVSGGMHLNFEVQYDIARMGEVPLLKATDEADARRAAYTYSTVTISSGLLFNF